MKDILYIHLLRYYMINIKDNESEKTEQEGFPFYFRGDK